MCLTSLLLHLTVTKPNVAYFSAAVTAPEKQAALGLASGQVTFCRGVIASENFLVETFLSKHSYHASQKMTIPNSMHSPAYSHNEDKNILRTSTGTKAIFLSRKKTSACGVVLQWIMQQTNHLRLASPSILRQAISCGLSMAARRQKWRC